MMFPSTKWYITCSTLFHSTDLSCQPHTQLWCEEQSFHEWHTAQGNASDTVPWLLLHSTNLYAAPTLVCFCSFYFCSWQGLNKGFLPLLCGCLQPLQCTALQSINYSTNTHSLACLLKTEDVSDAYRRNTEFISLKFISSVWWAGWKSISGIHSWIL